MRSYWVTAMLFFAAAVVPGQVFAEHVMAAADLASSTSIEGGSPSPSESASMTAPMQCHDDFVRIETGKPIPTVDFELLRDQKSGWNLHIITSNFRFTPENVGTAHVSGEGHAHLFIDGVKVARIYSAWYHIEGLQTGLRQIAVSLNGNQHSAYLNGQVALEAIKKILIEQ